MFNIFGSAYDPSRCPEDRRCYYREEDKKVYLAVPAKKQNHTVADEGNDKLVNAKTGHTLIFEKSVKHKGEASYQAERDPYLRYTEDLA